HVGDTLKIITLNEEQIESYVDDLNKSKSKIRFIHEYQRNNTINILDTTL
ncbi:unnamed protein product, partial [Rotaria sp. Silwood1]